MNQGSRACRRLAASVMLGLAAGAVWSATAPTSGILHFESVSRLQVKSGDQPARLVNEKLEQTLWFRDRSFRVETVTERGKQITIGGPDGVFVLRPGRREATRLPPRTGLQEAVPGAASLGLPDVAWVRQHKKVGSAKLGAYTTDIYEWSWIINRPGAPKGQKASTRVWVSREVLVPVQVVQSTPPHYSMTNRLMSARWNAEVPESMFRLPRGTRVRELTSPAEARTPRREEGPPPGTSRGALPGKS